MWQLSGKDKALIKKKGVTIEGLKKQWNRFFVGFQTIELLKPATMNDGIKKIDINDTELQQYFNTLTIEKSFAKFVPASGAATRMMNPLYDILHKLKNRGGDNINMDNSVSSFFNNLPLFAFNLELDKSLKSKGLCLEDLLNKKQYMTIINELLGETGLGFGQRPKAFIPFHKYGKTFRTAFEEHLVEGAMYCKSRNERVNIHFTISKEHEENFKQLVSRLIPLYEKQYHVKYNLSFSCQCQSTDMIAKEDDNSPARYNDGKLLFRPGGHGALLNNLNAMDEDVVFIKNIDNVVHERFLEPTIKHKKLLAVVLYKYKAIINDYIILLKSGQGDKAVMDKIKCFVENDLCVYINRDNLCPDELAAVLLKILKRPLRICGMVKSQGDTGGGPYWVKNTDGTTSLQIVETSQIDLNDDMQREILNNATHFNPADIVCSFKDEEGKKYDLQQFKDPETGIITKKEWNGKKITVQELPGLWNGSMAYWNTVFVEVPLATFNPVKSIHDLLNKTHQPV